MVNINFTICLRLICFINLQRSHASLFYFHEFFFIYDLLIFTVAYWSSPHREPRLFTNGTVMFVTKWNMQQFLISKYYLQGFDHPLVHFDSP